MKNKFLGLLVAGLFGASAFGQIIEIHHDGEVLESPEATVDGEVGGTYYFQGYYVLNMTDASINLSWKRYAEFTQSCLADQVCTDESCYTPFDDGATFNSPEPVTIASGDSTYFKVGANSYEFACCAIHKYYLYTGLGAVQDSITVKFRIGETECFLGVEEEAQVEEVSIYPNPSSSILNILATNTYSNATFNIYNVVGEVVVSRNLVVGKNEVNVENLPNGVYFYAVMQEGQLVETKKLIIKH